MNGFLVDTNILSELTNPAPAPQVEAFLRRSQDRVFVSVFSIGEIRKGIAPLPVSTRRANLEDWLDNEIMPWFRDRVLIAEAPTGPKPPPRADLSNPSEAQLRA